MVGETKTSPFEWGSDYIAHVDNYTWLLNPLLPPGGIMNIFGKPKSGKSMAAMGMAIAISSGASMWNGFPIEMHGPVAYFQIDTPRFEWKQRWQRIAAAGYDISKIGIMDMGMSPYPYNILTPQHQAWLRQQLGAIQPVLTIVDTLREVHDGNENDSTDMKKVINALVSLVKPYNSALTLLSHSRKDSMFTSMGGDSDLMDEQRGSGYVSGRMDTIIRFSNMKGKPPKGTMTYKGRSVSQEKVPVVMDPETYLVQLEGDRAREDQLVMQVVREHANDWSKNKMAEWIAEQLKGSISVKTATRRITDHMKLVAKVV